MASDFPAYVARGHKHSFVEDYVAGTGTDEPFIVGDFWYYNTTNNEVQLCAADPVLIGGISETDSAVHRLLTPDNKVPVRIITGQECQIAMASATTPAISHIGDGYGITRNASAPFNWLLDTAKTTTSIRVWVNDVDIDAGIFYVSLGPTVMQFGGGFVREQATS
jgi:hypothetical protein